MPTQSKTLSVVLPGPLRDRFSAVKRGTDLDQSTLIRGALEALCAYYEEHGSVAFPMQMRPRSSLPTVEEIVTHEAPSNPAQEEGRPPTGAEMQAAWLAWQQSKGLPRPASDTPEMKADKVPDQER